MAGRGVGDSVRDKVVVLHARASAGGGGGPEKTIFNTAAVIDADGTYRAMNRLHEAFKRIGYPQGHEGRAGQVGQVFAEDGVTPLRREQTPTYRASQGEEFDDCRLWIGADPLTLHWQTNADTTNMRLTLPGPGSYVLAGVFAGNQRLLSATPLVGPPLTPVSIVDASHSIAAGDELLYLGSSDAGDASNAAIGEVVYFSRALDAGERAAVIANLRARWRPH